MKNKFREFWQGILIGISNVIPGFSGGTMALILGIYEWFTASIAQFTKNPIKAIKDLWALAVGMMLGILIAVFTIAVCLEKWPIITSSFFVGLVLATIPITLKKINGRKPTFGPLLSLILCLTISLILPFGEHFGIHININNANIFVMIFILIVAALASATMIIPAASGAMILLAFGVFDPILQTLKNALISLKDGNFSAFGDSCLILVPFVIGAFIGVILIAKIITYAFKKKDLIIWYGILGLLFASVFTIYYNAYDTHIGENIAMITDHLALNIILSIVMFLIGFFGLRYLTKYADKKELHSEEEKIAA